MKFVIITGLSGAGKSQAVKCLEDLGFYCIDNLPPTLIRNFVELCFNTQNKIDKVALVIDIRGGYFFEDLISNLSILEEEAFNYDIIFLDASDEVLVKRFKESRRLHPLSKQGNILSGIELERDKLSEIKEMASYIIDTSNLTNLQLKQEIKKIYTFGENNEDIIIIIESFGFKEGIPLDVDMIFDVRFLPNPFYIKEMRKLNGNDKEVRKYVMKWRESKEFISKIYDLIKFLLPYYTKEGKAQIIIGFGCTGGQHRSVTIANEMYEILEKEGKKVILIHRELQLY